SVSEVKRVSLDAGQQLDHFESHYKAYTRPGKEIPLVSGIGLKKVTGEVLEFDAKQGWLAKWDPVSKNAGEQGLAIIAAPGSASTQAEDNLNQLMLIQVPADGVVSYWAGFCWDRAGQIQSFDAWKQYVADFAQGLSSPIEVTVASTK
ncbi:MAG: DUF4861 family protein, partial [Verrucomicrobia bacterium]|nr:DUF4861 family protein [Verrucomicrobiota bacterium]